MAGACTDGDNLLAVELQTDLVPGVEFTGVRTSLPTGQVELRDVTAAEDFGDGRRVAELARVVAGPTRLQVELLDALGVLRLVRQVDLDILSNTVARVVMSRDCVSVTCGPTETCFGGRCVSRSCSSVTPAACGTAACGNDQNCDAPVPCADPVCADGACLQVPRRDRCPLGRYCDPESGCRAEAEMPDAGPPQDIDAAVAPACEAGGRNLYVNAASGDDSLTGLSPSEPFATINRAFQAADLGDCINLVPGEYRGDVATRRDGTPAQPILLRGPTEAVVRGEPGGSSVVVRVEHDHVHLEGFTIDGFHGEAIELSDYHRTLIEVRSRTANEGVSGFVGRDLTLRNALRQCVGFRYLTTSCELDSVTVEDCGLERRLFGGTSVGWGVIVGTSPSNLSGNPTDDPDASTNNLIRDSTFLNVDVCVGLREDAGENTIEGNRCSAKEAPTLAGIDLRSNRNIARNNEVFEGDGAGIRVGGERPTDGTQNVIRDNIIRDNGQGGIRFQAEPQAEVCGNEMSGNSGGDATGAFGVNFNPTAACVD